MTTAGINEYPIAVRWMLARFATIAALESVDAEERPVSEGLTDPHITFQYLASDDRKTGVGHYRTLSVVRLVVTARTYGDSLEPLEPLAAGIDAALDGDDAEGVTSDPAGYYCASERIRTVRPYPDLAPGGVPSTELGGVYEITVHQLT